jgi:hypothetical protein
MNRLLRDRFGDGANRLGSIINNEGPRIENNAAA